MSEAAIQDGDQQQHTGRSLGATLWMVIQALILLYLAGFALVIIDTIFFGERLWNLMPDALQGEAAWLVQTIYAPLIWVLGLVI